MPDTIVIDESTLTKLRDKYVGLLDEIDTRLVNYKWGDNPDSQLTLGDAFPLRLGGGQFAEAVSLASDLDHVRQRLTGRIDSTYTNATNLRWGLQYLLEDSDAVEHLNTMTGEEFESFIPTSSASPGDGGDDGAGS
ncbi:hypothetical protein [Frankia tisae]|uniref:hypothetical protein n=1 Tax=Frankia tisae TaxID=2950104 RepID=UPI0021C1CE75|nr:hypothetical protein [Frankia tisae]